MTKTNLRKKLAGWQAVRLLFDFKKHAGLPLLFLLLIFLPMADQLFDISPHIPIKEKRKLAAKPKFSLGHAREFFNQYEAYLNDHFGFRKHLVFHHNRLTVELFRTSPTVKVLIGRQGWLFISNDNDYNNEIISYRALKPFSQQELVQFKIVLEQRRDWLAKRGCRYVFMVAPNKSTIYPEFLPATIRKAHPQTRMDQLIDYLAKHSSLRILDMRPALLAAKAKNRIYHKTDSHWNDLGGYFAYREIILHLQRYFPDVKPRPLGDFKIDRRLTQGGDLAIMLSLQKKMFRETRITVRPKVPFRSRRAVPTAEFPEFKWIHLTATACPGGQIPAAVMVRDSFAHQFYPYLSEHFRRMVYIWDWGLHFYPDVIEKEKPVIVIDQMVEWALMNRVPKNPQALQRRN
jgi:alginate O-acetyltransferase complex protein AlgJ